MKINVLIQSRFRNLSIFQCHRDILKFVEQENLTALKISAEVASYKIAFNRLDDILKKIVKSIHTEEIAELDKTRDRIFSGILSMINAALKHFSPEVVTAAKKIKILLNTYGNVNTKTYNDQTASIVNLMQEFKGPYKNEVAITRIKDWTDQLEATNNEFEELMETRMREQTGKDDLRVKDARLALDETFKTFSDKVNALVIVDGAQNYEELIKNINGTIKKYDTMIVQSKPRKKKTEKESGGE